MQLSLSIQSILQALLFCPGDLDRDLIRRIQEPLVATSVDRDVHGASENTELLVRTPKYNFHRPQHAKIYNESPYFGK